MEKDTEINGGFFVNKPKGLTSRKVDNIISKAINIKRVGHIGTLDPLAEGILPVLIGKATKLSRFVDSGIKAYRVEIILGITTDTDDATGVVISVKSVKVNPNEVLSALKKFEGKIEQVPPKYSAKKRNGIPYYRLARRGFEFEIKASNVQIFSIANVEIDLPKVKFDVECSTGTYMRAIARDLGSIIDCGGHLSGLVRTRVGPHTLQKTTNLDVIIDSIQSETPRKYLVCLADLIPHIPRIRIKSLEIWQVVHGQIIQNLGSQFRNSEIFALTDSNDNVIAIAEKESSSYKYLRVLV